MRRKLQLEVEETALKGEKDQQSKTRLKSCQRDLAHITEQLEPLQLKHESEKKRVNELRRIKNKIQEIHRKIAAAERARNLELVADLRYGALPDLTQHLERLTMEDANHRSQQNQSEKLLVEEVTPGNIADVVARSTGIPAGKLRSTESDKLLNLADRLGERVVGQPVAVRSISQAV